MPLPISPRVNHNRYSLCTASRRKEGSWPAQPQFCLQVVFRDPAVGNLHPRGLPIPRHPGGGAVLTAARGAQDGAAPKLPLRAVRSPSLHQCPDFILGPDFDVSFWPWPQTRTVSTHGLYPSSPRLMPSCLFPTLPLNCPARPPSPVPPPRPQSSLCPAYTRASLTGSQVRTNEGVLACSSLSEADF